MTTKLDMNVEEIFEKIKNKELTICETCDNIFDYVPQKVFCDECKRKKARARNRKYYEENLEKVLARQRKYREENREKRNAYQRKYREENLEKVRARERKYREENREKLNARKRERYHAKKKEE